MKKVISILLVLCVVCASLVFASVTANAGSTIESALSWALNIANDDSHRYVLGASHSENEGTNYDCSSFVSWALRHAGLNVPISTTYVMRQNFEPYGFEWIPWSSIGGTGNLQRGDILLDESTHVEFYYGNNQMLGAHNSSSGISVYGYYNNAYGVSWDGVLRLHEYSDPIVETWYYDGATDYSDFRPVIRFTNPETVLDVTFAVRYENTDWKWYTGDYNGGNAWYCDVLSKDLGTGTTITCHAYVRGKNGSYKGYPYLNLNLGKDANPEAINWYYDGATEHSDFRPVIRISNPITVSYVRFAVRYESTDWKWYEGTFNGSNAWYCDILSSDLGTGQYIVCHAYVYAKNGNYKGYPLDELKLDKDYDDPIINKWEYKVLTENKKYRAIIGIENPETVSIIKFAIRDDSTDWKWFDGFFDGEYNWYYDIDFNELELSDTAYCHAYIQGKNGFYNGYPFPEIKIDDTSPTQKPTEETIIPILGDADGNGDIEIFDATLIQRYVSNMSVPYPEETLMNADVDGDDELTIIDATFIQRHIARITTPYPIGEVIS